MVPAPARLRAATLLAALLLLLPAALQAGPPAAAARDAQQGLAMAAVQFHGAIPADVAQRVAPWGRVVAASEPLRAVAVEGSAADLAAMVAALRGQPGVARAYVAGHAELLAAPDDPHFAAQWGFAAARLPAAWDEATGSHAVRVAVLDTGIDYTHPDLQPNTVLGDGACGPDLALAGAAGPLAVDDHGHGTHVAGIAAAVTNNGQGVAGAAQACLMVVKVCTPLGVCPYPLLAMGIAHAAAHGADVITMSLGATTTDALVEDAVRAASKGGALLLAAAGNDGCGGPDTVRYPAALQEVVAVAALASPAEPAWFSSCGPAVEVAAPGHGILSTWLLGAYGNRSGTSMATPLVAGIAALAKAAQPGLDGAAVRCLLAATAADLGAPGRDARTGHGRVDAAALLAAAAAPAARGC